MIVKNDFALASLNAICRNFKITKISRCLFHLGQAIERKFKELNLITFHKTQLLFNNFVNINWIGAYGKITNLWYIFQF